MQDSCSVEGPHGTNAINGVAGALTYTKKERLGSHCLGEHSVSSQGLAHSGFSSSCWWGGLNQNKRWLKMMSAFCCEPVGFHKAFQNDVNIFQAD
jgi:hypothetical protein